MTAVVVRNIVGFLVQVAPAGFAEQSDGFMYYPRASWCSR